MTLSPFLQPSPPQRRGFPFFSYQRTELNKVGAAFMLGMPSQQVGFVLRVRGVVKRQMLQRVLNL